MTEREIFLAALKQPTAGERAAFLDQACGADASLRGQIEALLAEHEQLGSYLESPVGAGQRTVDQPPVAELPGTVIGPYKLLQQIGEGGMGVVWMAEQTRPVQRKVALKLIKAGMDSRQVVARFEAERQALAMMDHVNIARVFDGGATETGRPYFVMELVHGVPITKYCDDNHLTPRERLELFVPVCQAVQHAHQKGIIHRDIKPSNVLVALYDPGAPGVPKVIDFGVAKATESASGLLTERTLFTQFGTMVGTLEYMSPEQAEMSPENVGIDTRSDIYSLGVLLYELLTGSTPLTHKRMKEAAYAEILRLIKEEEPPKPSTRLSDSGEALASISAQRKTEPAKLTKLVRGELDWIVMKCLEKDRNRRYESASAFAADMHRYLTDEPVQACPPSAGYRFRKFARRNKLALITGGLVGLSLVVGTAVSVWQAARARQAEQVAEAKQEQAEENFRKARDAVNEYFTLVSQNKLLNAPGLQALRRDLLEAALRYYEGMLDRHEGDPAVLADIAATHMRVSTIYHALDRNDDGLAALAKGLAIVERLIRDYPGAREHRRQLAGVFKFGESRGKTGMPKDPAAAQRTLLKALEIWTALASENPSVDGFQSDIASLHWVLGLLEGGAAYIGEKSRYAQAVEHLQKAGAMLDALGDAHPEDIAYLHFAIAVQGDLGWHLTQAGNQRSAQNAYARRQELQDALVARFPDDLSHQVRRANQALEEGFALISKEPAKAEERFRQAEKEFESLITVYPTVAEYQIGLASSYRGLHEALFYQNGRVEEQTQHARKAVAIYERLLEDFPERRHSLLQELGHNYRYLGFRLAMMQNYAAARAAFEASSEVFRECAEKTSEGSERATCLTGRAGNSVEIASLWEAEGRGDEVQAPLREALERYELLLTEGLERYITPGWINGFHNQLAQVLERIGTLEDAQRISGELHPSGPEVNSEGLLGVSSCYVQIARILLRAGQSSEAEVALRQAMSNLSQAVAKGFKDAEQLKNDPRFEPLRSRDDFQKLLDRIGGKK